MNLLPSVHDPLGLFRAFAGTLLLTAALGLLPAPAAGQIATGNVEVELLYQGAAVGANGEACYFEADLLQGGPVVASRSSRCSGQSLFLLPLIDVPTGEYDLRIRSAGSIPVVSLAALSVSGGETVREQIELSEVAGGMTGTVLVNGQAAVGRYVGLRTSDPQGQFVGYADPSTDANGVFRAIIAAGEGQGTLHVGNSQFLSVHRQPRPDH
ncbi:MAG: hypothetical protein R2748_18195 [Bryobacterales bacterium]